MKNALMHMLELAKAAQAKAYAPYSNFHVGACISTPDGHYFSGCNVENAAYPVGQCAETNTVGSMVAAGVREIAEIVVVGQSPGFCVPCGACRQVLNEFSTHNTQVHLFNATGEHKVMTMPELLPEAFGPTHLEEV